MDSEQLIKEIRKLYPDNTGEYLFKSCSEEWIVVLKKVDDTITNQCRLPSDNPNRAFAKYRANKLFVVDIINKSNPNVSVDEIYSSIYGNILLYIKGKIVECDSFNENLHEVCSGGIHFFETIDCAFYLEPFPKANGKWISWFNDGRKESEGECMNGKENGNWTNWYDNGQKYSEGEYLNGKKNGKWTEWYENGQKFLEGIFLNGEKNGQWTEWYYDGQKESEGEYLNGKKNGKWIKWIKWYQTGQNASEGLYLDGEEDGKSTRWCENGQSIYWYEWYQNGQKIRR